MTKLSKIIREVARNIDANQEVTQWIVYRVLDELARHLMTGDSVKLRGIGTFKWRHRRARRYRHPVTHQFVEAPATQYLGFQPATTMKGKTMAKNMSSNVSRETSDEGMDKYAVVLDDTTTKEGSIKNGPETCPICGRPLDSGRACPVHGTEPLEKKHV